MTIALIEIFAASLAPIVAVAGLGIGFLQWKLNQKRFKHELFDRRFAMFQAIQEFIGNVLVDNHVTDDHFRKLYSTTNGALFIFDEVIRDYIKLLANNAVALNRAVTEADTDQIAELSEWLLSQFVDSEQVFERFLKI